MLDDVCGSEHGQRVWWWTEAKVRAQIGRTVLVHQPRRHVTHTSTTRRVQMNTVLSLLYVILLVHLYIRILVVMRVRFAF